jgi:hypothetical protein
VFFGTVFGEGASARAALDTDAGKIELDSIQGDLGGGGLEIRYGQYSDGGADIDFNLTAYSTQSMEVEFHRLTAGDSKGIKPGIDLNVNIHSRDPLESSPGDITIVDHFTNVSISVLNSSEVFVASIPVASLLGGSANAADIVGMSFRFTPIGGGGEIAISGIRIVPEPASLLVLLPGAAIGFGRRGGSCTQSA